MLNRLLENVFFSSVDLQALPSLLRGSGFLLFRGGTIVDGTRVPRYRDDLGIKNGKIAQIGRLRNSDAKQGLDASGLTIAPGAINGHTHYDFQIHWDPYCTIGSWHGVTSVLAGA